MSHRLPSCGPGHPARHATRSSRPMPSRRPPGARRPSRPRPPSSGTPAASPGADRNSPTIHPPPSSPRPVTPARPATGAPDTDSVHKPQRTERLGDSPAICVRYLPTHGSPAVNTHIGPIAAGRSGDVLRSIGIGGGRFVWTQSTLAWSGPHCDPWRGGERPAAMAALRVGGGVAPEGGRPRRSASRRLARRRASRPYPPARRTRGRCRRRASARQA